MTCVVGIHVPGQGAVVACDSRITDPNTWEITSDDDVKALSCAILVGTAGHLGKTWTDFQLAPPRDLADFRARAIAGTEDCDYVLYCPNLDKLCVADSHGYMGPSRLCGVGAGSMLALGYLSAFPPSSSLVQAAKRARKAVEVAISRNASCGGQVRVFTAKKAT